MAYPEVEQPWSGELAWSASSDVRAWLSLKAVAWAWPERAHGLRDGQAEPKPSGRARLQPGPWLLGAYLQILYNLVWYTCEQASEVILNTLKKVRDTISIG
jgi:hypothetical protein